MKMTETANLYEYACGTRGRTRMNMVAMIGVWLLMLVTAAQSQTPGDQGGIQILRNGSQQSRQAPAERFTGSARVDPLFQATAPSHAGGALVTFEPGARTARHTHPLGQIPASSATNQGNSNVSGFLYESDRHAYLKRSRRINVRKSKSHTPQIVLATNPAMGMGISHGGLPHARICFDQGFAILRHASRV